MTAHPDYVDVIHNSVVAHLAGGAESARVVLDRIAPWRLATPQPDPRPVPRRVERIRVADPTPRESTSPSRWVRHGYEVDPAAAHKGRRHAPD